MKKILKTLSLLTFAIIFTSSMEAKAISIVPEVQEQFKSNYSCTIIMKEFEQLYDFGYFSNQQSTNQAITALQEDINTLIFEGIDGQSTSKAEQLNKKREDLRLLSESAAYSSNQVFKCATKDLNDYLSTEKWTKTICNPNSESNKSDFKENDILGCSIITGRIRFAYIPRFIVYSLELLTILSGVLSLLFVILGGYYYLINSLAGSDTEKGKSYIKNAIIGLIISLSAWSVINLVQLFFTS